jgi:outer membrane protein TolC
MQKLLRDVLAAMVFLAGAPGVANAQTSAPQPTGEPVVTRLGDLYAAVRRDNPKLRAARALTRAAEARVPGAVRPPDPQLQFGFMNYSLPDLAPAPPLGMPQLQLMQMLPLGGKLALAGRVASARASELGERAEEVLWTLRGETAMAFYELYAIDGQLDVARETLRLLHDIARTTEAMYRVGEGRQADVLRAQVSIARMAEDTLRMLAMRQTMEARLNTLRDSGAAAPLPAPVLPRFPDSIPRQSWADSIAANGRPMIRAGVEGVRAAKAAAQLSRREIIPDLQLGVQYGVQRVTMAGVDTNGDPMSQSRTERMGSLMLGVSLPIFARDRQLRMRAEASATAAMAEAEVAAMRAETRGLIGEAYAQLTRARNLARLYRSTVLPQAEATAAAALSAYRVGSVDFMTLLDDRMAVNTYRQQLFALDADEGKAWAQLEMLTGRELIDANSVADRTAWANQLDALSAWKGGLR